MRTLTGGARPSLPAPTGPGAVPVHEVGGGKSAAVVGAAAHQPGLLRCPKDGWSAEPTLMQKVHRLAQSRAGERPAAQRPHRSATMSRAIAGGPEAMPNGLALGSPIPPHAAPPRSPADGIGRSERGAAERLLCGSHKPRPGGRCPKVLTTN